MTVRPYVTGSPEWHELRARHVGASEVSALFGVQPEYALSHYALWMIKAGQVTQQEVAGERVFWGNRLESLIAEVTAEAEGWTIRKGGYAEDDECRGLGASLDYEIEGNAQLEAEGYRGNGLLECKAVDWLIHKRGWTGGEPPEHVLLQLQAQCAARGYSWGAVGALISGNQRAIYKYQARPKLIDEIRRRVRAFWASIDMGLPPPPDGSSSASAVLSELYPVAYDDAIDMSLSNEWAEAAHALFNAAAERKVADYNYDEAKNRVAGLLRGHRRGYGGGWAVNTIVTPANPGRLPKPGELIGKRAESRRYTAKEMT